VAAAEFQDEPKDVVRLALTEQHRDSGIQVPTDDVGPALDLAALDAVVEMAGVAVLVVPAEAVDVLDASVLERFAASCASVRLAVLPASAVVEPAERQDQFVSGAE
jgi:hypothetical protein